MTLLMAVYCSVQSIIILSILTFKPMKCNLPHQRCNGKGRNDVPWVTIDDVDGDGVVAMA